MHVQRQRWRLRRRAPGCRLVGGANVDRVGTEGHHRTSLACLLCLALTSSTKDDQPPLSLEGEGPHDQRAASVLLRCRIAWARWLSEFFCCGASSAAVAPSSSTQKYGS